jgi:hypothetical protein
MLVEPQSDVAFARSSYCVISSTAGAYAYGSGNQVGGGNGGHGAYWDTYSECLSAGQALAIQVSGSACGSYGAGQAYALVEWHITWDGTYQGQVNQQFDCGDV